MLAARYAPEVEKSIITQARDTALSAGAGVQEAVNLERERIRRGEVKDGSAVAQKLAIAQGISLDKMLILENRPSTTVEHRQDLSEILGRSASAIPGCSSSPT
jgi:hypothetical protein